MAETEATKINDLPPSPQQPTQPVIKFIGQGSFSCVYRPAIQCDDSIDPNNPNARFFVSKITVKDHYKDNEFYIADILKTIPHYYNYFSPILESCDANLFKLGKQSGAITEFQQCNLFHPSTVAASVEHSGGNGGDNDVAAAPAAYMYNKIRFVGDQNIYDYLQSTSLPLVVIMDVFNYISHSMNLLVEKGIVHYDFKGDNAIIHNKHHIPIIIDFGLSIDVKKIIGGSWGANATEALHKAFYIYSPEYEVWCPMIHFICYFTCRKEELSVPIKIEVIEKICADFFSLGVIFKKNYISNNDAPRYKDVMTNFYRSYIGKPALEVIVEFVRVYYKTWDYYSLVVCFCGILRNRGENIPPEWLQVLTNSFSPQSK
jgi:serine/threonine protein kinase